MNILNEEITRKRYPPLPILDFSRTSKNQYILFYSSFPQLVAGCLTPHLLLPPPPNSSAVLLSLAFSFAPNLRPIIAAEEAISNLNETPSRSAPALLASPRLAIDRIHHRRSSSPVGRPRNFFSRDDRMPTRNSLLPSLRAPSKLRPGARNPLRPHIRVSSFYFADFDARIDRRSIKDPCKPIFLGIFEKVETSSPIYLIPASGFGYVPFDSKEKNVFPSYFLISFFKKRGSSLDGEGGGRKKLTNLSIQQSVPNYSPFFSWPRPLTEIKR